MQAFLLFYVMKHFIEISYFEFHCEDLDWTIDRCCSLTVY